MTRKLSTTQKSHISIQRAVELQTRLDEQSEILAEVSSYVMECRESISAQETKIDALFAASRVHDTRLERLERAAETTATMLKATNKNNWDQQVRDFVDDVSKIPEPASTSQSTLTEAKVIGVVDMLTRTGQNEAAVVVLRLLLAAQTNSWRK